MVNALDPQNINSFSEASVSVEIETEDMTLNIGPQHPSTHGVLRLVAKVDFPTPPLALEIAMVNLVPLIGFFSRELPLSFFLIASLNSGFSFGI